MRSATTEACPVLAGCHVNANPSGRATVPKRRTTVLVLAAAVLASACAQGSSTSGGGAATPTSSGGAAAESGCTTTADLPGGGQVLAGTAVGDDVQFPWDRPDVAVADGFDLSRVRSGGPPPDGIQPVDAPCFESLASASSWLGDTSPLLVVQVGDEVRAYPLAIMTQHEIVNDVIAGVPVVVTYCPLCNSGLAFERTLDGEVLDFGTSGRLFQSNLVMYDRQTRGLWTQFDGEAVAGEPYVGTSLPRLPTNVLGLDTLIETEPDALVLSRDSMPGRSYGRNPYPGYDDIGIEFGLFEGDTDDRLPANTRVIGLGDERGAVAVPLPRLQDEQVVEVDVDGPVVVFWAEGANSALDTAEIDLGADVGQTGAFRPVAADGTALTFTPTGDGMFVDDQTGTTWDLRGKAVDGDLAGETLEPVPLDDTFWFVWFAFRPETAVAAS